MKAIAVCALVAGALLVLARGSPPPDAHPAAAPVRLPAAPAPAFEIGAAVPARRDPYASTWASVRRDTVARRRPGGAPVARLAARTPEATTNLVPVLGRRSVRGALWVRVRLPVLPNGTTGWVPRATLGTYGTVTTRLDVDLARRRLTLRRDGRTVLRAPVGIGTAAAPTPRGEFVVRNRLTRYRSAFYGPVAFGTSARSATLTDWPGGGFIGIHGTDAPQLIPGAVSHGCIRLRNADILRLAKLMPVGTPVSIH
jgi:lipoprotein-anchoring transpeptidase ErfK/SrfK